MTRSAYDREHERDLAKHDWRHGDNPVLGKFSGDVDPKPRDRLHWRQEHAVLKLTGYLDGVIGTGVIPTAIEMELRERVIEAQVAFNIPTKSEREPA